MRKGKVEEIMFPRETLNEERTTEAAAAKKLVQTGYGCVKGLMGVEVFLRPISMEVALTMTTIP